MKSYSQLSYEERVTLAQFRQSETPISEIADKMGRSPSTIYRELKRNQAPPGEYWPDTANTKARARCLRGNMLDRIPLLREFVIDGICYRHWAPEQVAGHLTHRQNELPSISHETIYAWIYGKKQQSLKLWQHLTRRKKKRGLPRGRFPRKSRIPNRTSIHERPSRVNERKEFGHWECDTMAFENNTQHIAVSHERTSMFTIITRLPNKRSEEAAEAIISSMLPLPKRARKTITFDNGTEFAKHEKIGSALAMNTFFCDSYASWQKGGVENANGRLRLQLPRQTNIKALSSGDFYGVMSCYNSTPRKKLGWKTPAEAFSEKLNFVALQT